MLLILDFFLHRMHTKCLFFLDHFFDFQNYPVISHYFSSFFILLLLSLLLPLGSVPPTSFSLLCFQPFLVLHLLFLLSVSSLYVFYEKCFSSSSSSSLWFLVFVNFSVFSLLSLKLFSLWYMDIISSFENAYTNLYTREDKMTIGRYRCKSDSW